MGSLYGVYMPAGKFREMCRLLRVKNDLQQVVVSSDYSAQSFTKRGTTAVAAAADDNDDDEQLDADIGQRVKNIILDERGFWNPFDHDSAHCNAAHQAAAHDGWQ